MKPFRNTVYRGFSSVGGKKLTNLYDIELVKQDLLNHFNIRKTERIGQPSYGSNILDYLFEIQNENNVQQIVDNVVEIINDEPRVALIDISVNTSDDYTIVINCQLLYIGTNVEFDFRVKFDTNVGITEEVEE
jgi:phage baseplate assembly protein W